VKIFSSLCLISFIALIVMTSCNDKDSVASSLSLKDSLSGKWSLDSTISLTKKDYNIKESIEFKGDSAIIYDSKDMAYMSFKYLVSSKREIILNSGGSLNIVWSIVSLTDKNFVYSYTASTNDTLEESYRAYLTKKN